MATIVLCVAVGCEDDGDPVADASQQLDGPLTQPDRGTSDAAGDAAAAHLMDTGPVHLAACEKMASSCGGFKEKNCGKCEYRIRYDRRHCSKTKPCDNLFVLWTAGTCEGPNVTKALDQIINKNNDFVAACVAPQVPAQMLPVTLGAPERDKALVTQLFGRLRKASELGVWSGDNLLLGGCSAGGTRYPMVAARYPDDADWVGDKKTGACFSDGVVSITVQDAFIGGNLGKEADCTSRHGRVIKAYTHTTPQAKHACSNSPNKQCPCDPNHVFRSYAGDCGGGDCVTFDSIVVQKGTGFALASGVKTSDFAVTRWKLITEGSSFAATDQRCEKDVCPKGPYRALCQAIDADPKRSCTFVSKPTYKHCSYYFADLNESCVTWFRGLK